MLRTDDLHSRLDGYGRLLLRVLTGACPLGGIIVRQLTNPVSESNLDVTIERSNGEVLCVCEREYVCLSTSLCVNRD